QESLSVTSVGPKSRALAPELAVPEQCRIDMNENGLDQCCRLGQLIYESDISSPGFPFLEKLNRLGLRSLVFAPLIIEGNVFGVMIAGRRALEGFTGEDCEFLQQLSGHVALAAHQSHLYGALQRA